MSFKAIVKLIWKNNRLIVKVWKLRKENTDLRKQLDLIEDKYTKVVKALRDITGK